MAIVLRLYPGACRCCPTKPKHWLSQSYLIDRTTSYRENFGMLRFIALFSILALAGSAAHATPAFAKKEGKPCSFCHTNPSGGGKRNDAGNYYKTHGLSLKGFAGAAPATTAAPAPKMAAAPAPKKAASAPKPKTKAKATPAPKKPH